MGKASSLFMEPLGPPLFCIDLGQVSGVLWALVCSLSVEGAATRPSGDTPSPDTRMPQWLLTASVLLWCLWAAGSCSQQQASQPTLRVRRAGQEAAGRGTRG